MKYKGWDIKRNGGSKHLKYTATKKRSTIRAGTLQGVKARIDELT